jgi:queuine tRNA-ribosyltransferase
VDVQIALGADIMPWPSTSARNIRQSGQPRRREPAPYHGLGPPLARRTFNAHRHEVVWRNEELGGQTQTLFGIVQGRHVLATCAAKVPERLVEMDQTGSGFAGYAIGGLSVGEPRDLTLEMISEVLPLLPSKTSRAM